MPAHEPGGNWNALGIGIELIASGEWGKRCGQPPSAMPSSGPNWAATMKSIAFRTGFRKRSSCFSRYIRSMNCDATAVPASSNVALP